MPYIHTLSLVHGSVLGRGRGQIGGMCSFRSHIHDGWKRCRFAMWTRLPGFYLSQKWLVSDHELIGFPVDSHTTELTVGCPPCRLLPHISTLGLFNSFRSRPLPSAVVVGLLWLFGIFLGFVRVDFVPRVPGISGRHWRHLAGAARARLVPVPVGHDFGCRFRCFRCLQ